MVNHRSQLGVAEHEESAKAHFGTWAPSDVRSGPGGLGSVSSLSRLLCVLGVLLVMVPVRSTRIHAQNHLRVWGQNTSFAKQNLRNGWLFRLYLLGFLWLLWSS